MTILSSAALLLFFPMSASELLQREKVNTKEKIWVPYLSLDQFSLHGAQNYKWQNNNVVNSLD